MKLIITNMNCSHCSNLIKNTLEKKGIKHNIDLDQRIVEIINESDQAKTKELITALGYKVAV